MRKNAGDKKSVEHILSFSRHKWCHKTINNRSPNLRISSDRYFQFHWICKQQWVEVKNSVPNWEVYFPLLSSLKLHILLALLWKLLLYDLIQCMYRLQQKHTVLDFFGHNVMQASCIFFQLHSFKINFPYKEWFRLVASMIGPKHKSGNLSFRLMNSGVWLSSSKFII